VLKEAQLDVSDFDEIDLLGGATQIPKIRQLLKVFFIRLDSFLNIIKT